LPDSSQDRTAFARVVRALRPYLDELVFVGGWAHRLLALHELAGALDFQPLMTSDVDIATEGRSRVQGSSMRDLLRQNGFTEELSGDERPPVTEYRLGEEDGALYVEFLAPQAGGPTRRDGSSDATIEVAGITAQKLKYLEVLLTEPWRVRLNDANGFPLGKDRISIKVPNPPAYLMHKVLVLRDRQSGKQPKDVLYVHDTILMFSNAFDELRVQAELVAKSMHPRSMRTFHDCRAEFFGRLDDRLRNAERVARESGRASPPTADQIRLVCQQGLERIFGSKTDGR
jgi:Nucleotidyltransferase